MYLVSPLSLLLSTPPSSLSLSLSIFSGFEPPFLLLRLFRYSVVLMDELDQLFTTKQDVVYNFFNWPTLPGSQLVVIAVANTMDMPEKLAGRVKSRMGTSWPLLYCLVIRYIASNLPFLPLSLAHELTLSYLSLLFFYRPLILVATLSFSLSLCFPPGMERINFPPYTRDQLIEIAQSRLIPHPNPPPSPPNAPPLSEEERKKEATEHQVIESEALMLAAARTTGVTGDARRMLDVCR
jgi:hypothetical protein